MTRLYIPIILFAVFAIWALYRLLIKKDLRKHLVPVYIGLTFASAWIIIYYFLLKP